MWSRLVAALGSLGSDPADPEELARAKRLMVLSDFLIMILSVGWVALYWSYDELLAASIPGAYIVLTAISLAFFARNRQFRWFRNSQLLIMMLLPVALHFALGGFVSSSAVVIWSLFAPLGALAFTSLSVARAWFVGFLALLATAGVIGSIGPPENNLPDPLRAVFFVMNLAGISIVAFVMLYLFVGQLHLERARSERLLLNVLPVPVARRLRLYPDRVIADRFERASVLFADVVDFTPLSAGLAPENLVELLNKVFSDFDLLAEKYGVEKIKTIGDSYMAAAGVPIPREDHAQALAEMALDILGYAETHASAGEIELRFRIGINSGPVVAGVIGRRKFIYDLWGDAVNTASRMESHGEAGTIHVTEATYQLLKDQYQCEPHGTIEVKGKGPMMVWHLVGRALPT